MMDQHAKEALDAIIGVGAVSSPIWIRLIETGFAVVMALGGAILLALRIALAVREWREGRAQRRRKGDF
jgi:hypothetical protein